MANRKRRRLKYSNPKKYYKRSIHWLGFGKFLCSIVPPVTVLSIYAACSASKYANTNPMDPTKFGIGMVLLVVGIVILVANELKRITKESKANGNGEQTGPIFTSTIVWLFVATILWLFYLTMYWLIIFCLAEFVGTFFGAICSYNIIRCRRLYDKAETAEINADANYRKEHENDENA